MTIIPYDDVLRAQTARSSSALAESVASKWFQSTLCSIREKELAVAHVDRTPDKDRPAAQLMKAALAKQKALLEEQRSAWRELHPSTVDHDMDDSVLEPTIGLESRSARTSSKDAASIGPHVQLEQGLKDWQPPWHATHPNMFATFPTAWPGLPTVLLHEQRHPSYWPSPPTNAWLYAGVVTDAAHLAALTTSKYASTYAVPILAIVGRALLPTAHRTNCVEWPLPIDPEKPSSCTSADHMRKTGTPGCIAADLHLLTADSAEHPALDVPDWLRLWPMLFSSYPLPDDYSKQRTDRTALRLQLAHELCGRSPPPWWCAPTDGAIGQATAAGLWTTELSSKLRGAMSARHAAQLYASHFWHSGVLASSALSCRAATAAAIIALQPACLSTADRARLQRLASPPPKTTRSFPLLQGIRDLTPNRINLATVIDPSTGQQVVYAPPKKHHQLGSARTMYQLLHKSAVSWCDDNCSVGNQPDSAWSHWRQKNCCSATHCPNADDNVHGTGFVLPTGHLLCPSCFTDWEAEILTRLNITRSQPCFKDAKGSCSGCTLATAPSRTRLRHLLVRGHLRDLCDHWHFLHHLPPNTMIQVTVVCILQLERELCDLHSTLDRKYILGVPSRIYTSVLGWLAWNFELLCTALPANHQYAAP
jgi:hypothetical protein